MEKNIICKKCRWFVKTHEKDNCGYCFYDPPVIVSTQVTTRSERPVVLESDFCHNHHIDYAKVKKDVKKLG